MPNFSKYQYKRQGYRYDCPDCLPLTCISTILQMPIHLETTLHLLAGLRITRQNISHLYRGASKDGLIQGSSEALENDTRISILCWLDPAILPSNAQPFAGTHLTPSDRWELLGWSRTAMTPPCLVEGLADSAEVRSLYAHLIPCMDSIREPKSYAIHSIVR